MTKMQNSFSNRSSLLKKFALDLLSLILYEIFSLLICLGAVKDKIMSSKFNKFIWHKRLIRLSIKRRTDWEMRRPIVSAPEMTPTYDCGAVLLGAAFIFYLYRKKKLKLQEISIKSSVILARSANNSYFLKYVS